MLEEMRTLRRRILSTLIAVGFVVGFTTFTTSCSSEPPPPPRPLPTRTEKAACPLGVMGASVAVEDTPNGVALVVVSVGSSPNGSSVVLRQRARDAAQLHGPFGRLGKGHHGRHQTGGHHGLHAFALPKAHATATDVERGARIEIVPEYPGDLDALRAGVRVRASKMTRMPCDL
jgi:hypothetical protein